MNNENLMNPIESFPISFSVICVGKELTGVFSTLTSFGFEGVRVQSTTMYSDIVPTEEDKLAIILTDGNSELLEKIAKGFYQAGVLTLIISTRLIESSETICDAQTITDVESMPLAVKGLLDPILKQGTINFDFHDLYSSLHNTGCFKLVETLSHSIDNRIGDVIRSLTVLTDHYSLKQVDNLSLIFYTNREMTHPLSMGELPPLSEYISTFPDELSVIWALNYDDEMPDDEVRLVAIFSGKNLTL